MTQTFIPGKTRRAGRLHRPLSAKVTRPRLSASKGLWRDGAKLVWSSVHIRDKTRYALPTEKARPKSGAESANAGQILQRLSTNYFFADFTKRRGVTPMGPLRARTKSGSRLTENDDVPEGLLDACARVYDAGKYELTGKPVN